MSCSSHVQYVFEASAPRSAHVRIIFVSGFQQVCARGAKADPDSVGKSPTERFAIKNPERSGCRRDLADLNPPHVVGRVGRVHCVLPDGGKVYSPSGPPLLYVTNSSDSFYHVSDRYVTYQTAKAAVVHFTRQVAWDFGAERIRCNCICPGDIAIPSDIEARSNEPGFLEERTLLKALKRPGHPRDIAFATLFLVSDLADWITGQALTVDGGEHVTFPIVGAQRWEEFLQQHPGYRLTPLV
jgi:NAD(P)-dependent dehydrogenase (short-subunit alcohol dehydrogenase family)